MPAISNTQVSVIQINPTKYRLEAFFYMVIKCAIQSTLYRCGKCGIDQGRRAVAAL